MNTLFQTYSGKMIDPLSPKESDICIEDIAHALANQCRFGGHCREFYSVGQHSCMCAYVAMLRGVSNVALALMHDAAEAYLVDLPRPIKARMPLYAEAESAWFSAIASRFGIDVEADKEEVMRIDDQMLATEHRDLYADNSRDWGMREKSCEEITFARGYEPFKISVWSPQKSERAFLEYVDVCVRKGLMKK